MAEDKLKDLIIGESSKPQGLLYHYTTQRGLIGIISTKSIWATHYQYLNDWLEIQDAYQKIYVNAIVEKLTYSEDMNKELYEFIKKNLIEHANLYDVFLMSFSDDVKALRGKKQSEYAENKESEYAGNRLSQWRAYSNHIGGYSIGFDYDQLKKIGLNAKTNLVSVEQYIRQCIYVREEKDSIATKIGKLTAEKLSEGINEINSETQNLVDSNRIISNIASHTVSSLKEAYHKKAISFKDEGFWEECEWRMVIYASKQELEEKDKNSDDPIVHHREGAHGITPYVVVPFNSDNISNGLIRSITIGPSRNQSAEEETLHRLLKQYGYKDVDIKVSKTPYRV
jgi:hypothetical protein